MITPQEGVVIAGRYTLVRALARGGMGSVWIARHRDLEVDVTVKFMAPTLVEAIEARTRFEREAKVAARLRSQHVVQIHDYGVEDGTPYIVMELLTGEALSTRLTREGQLPVPVAAQLVVQICKALRTAHDAGLVHRDLKPANIFLALKDEEVVVKVLDFGIAKAPGLGEAKADTESGVLLGSVHYMSPEQIRSSRTVDHRSDLWSVGVIVYRMLTGSLPFPGTDLVRVLMGVCHDPFPRASTVAPVLPLRIDDFFECALARDPEQRFQSAYELAEAFSAMALEPPSPSSMAPMPRWQRPSRIAGAEPGAMGATPDPPRVGERTSPRLGSAPILPGDASRADEVTKETTTLKRAPASSAPSLAEYAVEPLLPTVRKALPSAVDGLTIGAAPEHTVGTIPAVQMPDLRAEPAVQIASPATGHKQTHPQSWWLYLVAAALVVLCGSLLLVLRAVMKSPSAASEPTTASSAVPAFAAAPASVASATTPSAGVDAPATTRPEVAAAPSDSARAAAPQREKAPDIFRGDPFATSSTAAQPKASVQAPRPQPLGSVGQPPASKSPATSASATPKAKGNLLDRTD